MPVVNGAWVANTADSVYAPDNTFPGSTAAISNAAFPATQGNVQPATHAGWPADAAGHAQGCWKTTIVADVANGWPGTCDSTSLTAMTNQAVAGVVAPVTQQECSAACVADAACTTWQFNTDTSSTPSTTSCFIGAGMHCYQAPTSADRTVTAGQRLQRGDVRVLKDMNGYQILNLYNMGLFQSSETSADGAQRCANWCYSSINCAYWSYSADGCDVETAANPAEYPLTTVGVVQNNLYTDDQIAAEYIQHYCPPQPTTTVPPVAAAVVTTVAAAAVPTVPAAAVPTVAAAAVPTVPAAVTTAAPAAVCSGGVTLPIVGCFSYIILGGLLLATCLLCGLLCFFCQPSTSKKSKSTRAVKSKAKNVPKAPAVAPQPPVEMAPVVETPSQQPLLQQQVAQPQYYQQAAQPQPQYTYAQPVQYTQPAPQAQYTYAQPQYTQSFAVPAPQYQYAAVQQSDPLLQSRVAVPETPVSVPASNLPAEAGQYRVGEKVAVWSRNNNTWHEDAQISAVDQQGWHVRYNNNQTQKVVLFSDAQNIKAI